MSAQVDSCKYGTVSSELLDVMSQIVAVVQKESSNPVSATLRLFSLVDSLIIRAIDTGTAADDSANLLHMNSRGLGVEALGKCVWILDCNVSIDSILVCYHTYVTSINVSPNAP